MPSKGRSVVHPWYKGTHEWRVEKIAQLPKPIEYSDSVQGSVRYDPKILLLRSSKGKKVLWFTYWIATSKTKDNLKWGQGSPMLEETVLLELLRKATKQGFFTKGFLKDLSHELGV